MSRRNSIDDVWQYIDTAGGDQTKCWLWTGSMASRDRDRGFFSYEGKREYAYRVVYRLVKGPIPDGYMIRHTCDNPMCCNPAHLVVGTRSDNERDKTLTDRVGLPVIAVREIKRLLETTTYTQAIIALHVSAKFNITVSRESVRNIKLGMRRAGKDDLTLEEVIALGPDEVKRRMT